MIKNKLWKTWQIRNFSFVLQAFFMPEYQVTVLIWDFYYYLFFLWEKNKYVVVEKKKNRNKNNKKMHFDLSKNLSPYKCDCFFVVTGEPKKKNWSKRWDLYQWFERRRCGLWQLIQKNSQSIDERKHNWQNFGSSKRNKIWKETDSNRVLQIFHGVTFELENRVGKE